MNHMLKTITISNIHKRLELLIWINKIINVRIARKAYKWEFHY